jgi:hypothetical protein
MLGGARVPPTTGRTVQDDAKKSMLDILSRIHDEDGARLGDDPSELDDAVEEEVDEEDEVCARGIVACVLPRPTCAHSRRRPTRELWGCGA